MLKRCKGKKDFLIKAHIYHLDRLLSLFIFLRAPKWHFAEIRGKNDIKDGQVLHQVFVIITFIPVL
jgi:hypothetical protein